jgi:glycosyltransferase involved in cell wall biosynthesis
LKKQSRKKRILWVTFHFPPRQSGGVFRPIRIYKHLDKEQFEIDFLTISLLSSYRLATRDDTLLEEVTPKPAVYRVPSIEPESWLRGLVGEKRNGNQPSHSPGAQAPTQARLPPGETFAKRFLKSIYRRLIMLCYFPDQVFLWGWLSSLKALWLHLKSRYDLIYTTSNPPSGHLPGLILKSFGVRWIADFRDGGNLWIKKIQGYPKGALRQQADFYYDKWVLDRADYVITQSELLKEDLSRVYSVKHSRFKAIPNGYDEEDFAGAETAPAPFTKAAGEIHLLHVGSWVVNPGEIDMIVERLNALQSALKERHRELLFHAVGNDLLGNQQRACTIRFRYCYHGVISHPLLPPYLLAADCYFMSSSVGKLVDGARGVLPGKLWEYLRGGKPIILFGPQDEAWQIIKDSKLGVYLGELHSGNELCADALLRLVDEARGLHPRVSQHSWESRARALQEVLLGVLR